MSSLIYISHILDKPAIHEKTVSDYPLRLATLHGAAAAAAAASSVAHPAAVVSSMLCVCVCVYACARRTNVPVFKCVCLLPSEQLSKACTVGLVPSLPLPLLPHTNTLIYVCTHILARAHTHTVCWYLLCARAHICVEGGYMTSYLLCAFPPVYTTAQCR